MFPLLVQMKIKISRSFIIWVAIGFSEDLSSSNLTTKTINHFSIALLLVKETVMVDLGQQVVTEIIQRLGKGPIGR